MLITAYMFCDAIEFHATLLVTDCICNHPFYLSFFKTKNQMSSHKKWDFLLLLITNQIFSFRTGWEGQRSLLDPSHRFPLLQGTPKVPMSLVRSLQRIPDLLWGLHQVECAWISSSGSWPGGIHVRCPNPIISSYQFGEAVALFQGFPRSLSLYHGE